MPHDGQVGHRQGRRSIATWVCAWWCWAVWSNRGNSRRNSSLACAAAHRLPNQATPTCTTSLSLQPPTHHQPAPSVPHHDRQCCCWHGTHALVAASSPPSPQLVHCGLPLPSNVQASQPAPQLWHASFHRPKPVSQFVHFVPLVQSRHSAEQRTQVPSATLPQPASQLPWSQRPGPASSQVLQPSAQATQRPLALSSEKPESLREACREGPA